MHRSWCKSNAVLRQNPKVVQMPMNANSKITNTCSRKWQEVNVQFNVTVSQRKKDQQNLQNNETSRFFMHNPHLSER
jgi:hypothetical protein